MTGALETADAADWYRHERVGDGVTHVFEQHIYPFYRCNIWHVQGREYDLLVDSGLGAVNLLSQLPWLRAERILAVASHAHFDHIGGHHLFSRRACHALEAATLAAPTARETLADRYATLSMFSKLPPGGFRSEDYQVAAAPATRLLEHGDVIDLGDRHFEVLHVPGTRPDQSPCGRHARVCCFPAIVCMTGHWSMMRIIRTFDATWRACGRCASCR